MLACAHPGMQRTGDAVTSILPAGIRLGHESASLLRAVKGRPQGNPTPGRRRALSVSVMVLCSVQMGRGRKTQTNTRPVTRESAITPLLAFPCYDVMLPLKHCTDSAPAHQGAPGLSWGYRDWKRNTVSDGHYRVHTVRRYFGAPWWRSRSVPG